MAESASPTNKIGPERDSFLLAIIAEAVNIETIILDSGFRTPSKNLYRDLTEKEKDANGQN